MPLVFKFLLYFLSLPIFGIGTKFLMLPSSVEQLTIGDHSTLEGAIPINPALFSAQNKQSNLLINRGVWIGDVNIMNIAFNQTLGEKVFHFGVNYSGLTGFEYREERPVDLPLSYFSSYGVSVKSGLSLSADKNKFGLSLSYIKIATEVEEANGFGLNFGYVHNFSSDFNIGVSIENIGKMNKLISEEVKLPQRRLTTLSKKVTLNNSFSTIYGSIDWGKGKVKNKYCIGNSFSWKNSNLFSGFVISDNSTEASIGFSVLVNSVKVGYGVRFGSQKLGNPYLISLDILLP
jgi:hypothetical protein